MNNPNRTTTLTETDRAQLAMALDSIADLCSRLSFAPTIPETTALIRAEIGYIAEIFAAARQRPIE